MVSIVSLECPVCGAPFAPGSERCAYCGSIIVLQTDHPRIDPRALNRAVINERIAAFRETLRVEPDNVAAHYGLGVAYFNLGLTEAAIHELEHACRLTPENPHIHTQLAVAYRDEMRAGDRDAREEMEDHIQYAMRLDPDNVEAMLLQADLASSQEHYAKAIGHLERAYALQPERAREPLRDALLAAIRWREREGHGTGELRERLAQLGPAGANAALAAREDTPGTTIPALDPDTREQIGRRVATGRRRLRGAIKGFFIGVGIAFVALIVLAAISNAFEEDSTPYNVIIVLFLLTLFLPIALAVCGWYVGVRGRSGK